jgi:hypothetical protein
MKSWVSDIEFERHGAIRRAVRAAVANPLANYLPAGLMRGILRLAKSELAAANWIDPGGWRSMVISYDGKPTQIADKVLVGSGAMATALRNRRKLAGRWLAQMIDDSDAPDVHVLCLGAGPGRIIIDALSEARRPAHATLIDLNPEAFDYGCRIAAEAGVADRVRFVAGDVCDIDEWIDTPPDIVKMLGICEYLADDVLADIARAVASVLPPGAPLLLNSLSKAHGTDRFFRRVFGLHMIHRSPEQLQQLFAPAGFGDFVSIPEPLNVYHVIRATRRA